MFRNYIKTAWRSLMKNKKFSFINIFGLSIGLTCCMLIALYINYESSYDSYQANLRNLYQVGTVFIYQAEVDLAARTSGPIGPTMKKEFPEIEEYTRLVQLMADTKTLLQYDNGNQSVKSIYETGGCMVDPSFFRMFTYHFIAGNPATALNDPSGIVLSEEIATKLFGNQPAINKVIHISSNSNGDHDYKVTAVFRPINKPSHIDGRFFMNIESGDLGDYIKRRATDFASNNMFYTYLLLKPGTDAKKLESKFPAFMKKYATKDLKAMGRDKKQFLIPVNNIHLNSEVTSNLTPVIACINFMNLSTARSAKRSTEVGIRKVLGAEKSSLVKQFLGESMILALIAFIFAIVFATLLLPYFNEISGKNISFILSQNGLMLLGFLAMAILTGLIAGSYPALYLSSFRPVKVLKGKFSNSFAAISFRKALVVFQFVISVVLIVAAAVIAKQMRYMRNADLGFAKDQQLVIPLRSQFARNISQALKNEIKNNPQVISIGSSIYYPGIFNAADNFLYRQGQTMNQAKDVKTNLVDYDFLKTLDIKIVAGRSFSSEFPSDTLRAMVINEETVRELGFASPQQAVGQKLSFDFHDSTYNFDVVGVAKDFHFENLHEAITPLSFGVSTHHDFSFMIVHTRPGNITALMNAVQKAWRKLNPNEPFEYSFLDEDFQKNYTADNRLAAIVTYFTIIAIMISCLGLFGLATFSTEQRIKEIGVRKVLGASVSSIVTLISKDFVKLVSIAIVIASPLAWWIMNKWLQDFAYRIHINWVIFAITTVIALGIALATISFQAIKAALTNPVKSLRAE